MTELSRICPQCGKSFPLEARHCSHCGYDMDATLPAVPSTLPALVGKAAVPILAAIEANTAEWVAAQKAAEAAILAREQSRERLDACRRRVDEQLTSTYGALTQIHKSKAAANRYFP